MMRVLWNIAGQPTGVSPLDFPDVPEDHPAFDAIEWAASTRLTLGYDDGTFRPDVKLSRAHAVTFMERFYDDILQAERSEGFTRGDMMVVVHAIYNEDDPDDGADDNPTGIGDIPRFTEWLQGVDSAVSRENADGVVAGFGCYAGPLSFPFNFVGTFDVDTTTRFSQGRQMDGVWIVHFWDSNDVEILSGGSRLEAYNDTGVRTAEFYDGDAILRHIVANPGVYRVEIGVYSGAGYHFIYRGEWDYTDVNTHPLTTNTLRTCGYL